MVRRLFLPLFCAALVACSRLSIGAPTSEPCYAATGERDYSAEVLVDPPAEAARGSTIQVRFTGGYYDVLPSCQRVQGEETYSYPTIKDLRQRPRHVAVFLADMPIASFDCAYDCDLQITIPRFSPLGSQRLTVRPDSWSYVARQLEFHLVITP